MKKVVSWLFFIALGLAGLLLVLPGMIDWTRHKDVLVNELSARLGQDITIDGEVSLRLLPNPHVSMEKVTIGSAEKSRHLMTLAALDARMSMDDLLYGRFVIDQIHLQEPVINIAVDATGSNWASFWAARTAAQQAEPAAKSGSMVALKQMTVSRASVAYHNHVTSQQWQIDRMNMAVTADSLAGPYQVRGDMTYGEAPLTFTLATAARTPDGGMPFELDVTPIEKMPYVKATGTFNPGTADTLTAKVETREGKLAHVFAPFEDIAAACARAVACTENATTSFALGVTEGGVRFDDIKVSAPSGAALAGRAVFDQQKAQADVDVTLAQPARYALTYKGMIDTVRQEYKGNAHFKIEDAAKILPYAPAVSVEAAGNLVYTGGDSWTLSDTTLTLPVWQNAAMNGRIQQVNGATAFALTAAELGIAKDVSLNGQLAQSLTADGTATLFGKVTPMKISGAPATPDITVDLAGVGAQDVAQALGLLPAGITFEGGSATFTGKVDMAAETLAGALSGQVKLSPATVKLAGIRPKALQEKVLSLTSVPDDLGAQMHAALTSGDSLLDAKSIDVVLPLSAAAWKMTALSYDTGTIDVAVDAGKAGVAIKASDDSKLSFTTGIPAAEKDMPVDQAKEVILARHPPVPEVDTKEAIGDILNRLDDTPAVEETTPVTDLPPEEPVADMPPQPAAALPEIEVAPPPPLPEDTPLAVDIPPEPETVEDAPPQEYIVPDEIFPVEDAPVTEGAQP